MSVTPVPTTDTEALRGALGDARSVLLLAADDHRADEACTALLSPEDPADERLLAVGVDRTPDELLERWRLHVGDLPAQTGIIAAGETERSAAASAGAVGPGPAPVSVDAVPEPGDLTGLAIAISAYLDAWRDVPETPVVCFDSVTALLAHADPSRVFRFLHATTGRLADLGGVAHYHLDPSVVDEATVNTLTALFDAVVEFDADGTARVRRR